VNVSWLKCKLEVEMSGSNCPWKMTGEMFQGQTVSVKNIWGNCPGGGMSRVLSTGNVSRNVWISMQDYTSHVVVMICYHPG